MHDLMRTDEQWEKLLNPRIDIRWMIRRDMPIVLEIENRCYAEPHSEEDFVEQLRSRHCIGMVATIDNGKDYDGSDNPDVIGFIIYSLSKKAITLLHMAIHPEFCSLPVFDKFVDTLKKKVTHNRRTHLTVNLHHEDYEDMALWKKAGLEIKNVNGVWHAEYVSDVKAEI